MQLNRRDEMGFRVLAFRELWSLTYMPDKGWYFRGKYKDERYYQGYVKTIKGLQTLHEQLLAIATTGFEEEMLYELRQASAQVLGYENEVRLPYHQLTEADRGNLIAAIETFHQNQWDENQAIPYLQGEHQEGNNLLHFVIKEELYDMAFQLIRHHPSGLFEVNHKEETPWQWILAHENKHQKSVEAATNDNTVEPERLAALKQQQTKHQALMQAVIQLALFSDAKTMKGSVSQYRQEIYQKLEQHTEKLQEQQRYGWLRRFWKQLKKDVLIRQQDILARIRGELMVSLDKQDDLSLFEAVDAEIGHDSPEIRHNNLHLNLRSTQERAISEPGYALKISERIKEAYAKGREDGCQERRAETEMVAQYAFHLKTQVSTSSQSNKASQEDTETGQGQNPNSFFNVNSERTLQRVISATVILLDLLQKCSVKEMPDDNRVRVVFFEMDQAQSFQQALQIIGFHNDNHKDKLKPIDILKADLEHSRARYVIDLSVIEWQTLKQRLLNPAASNQQNDSNKSQENKNSNGPKFKG